MQKAESKLRVVFMGTPEFAACSLRAVKEAGHEIAAVFTQPDKPKSRGMQLTASPVKKLAEGMGLPVYQPKTLRDGEAERIIREINPDIIVVVAYGKILPESILDVPSGGCVNVHASLLPKYRGAAPIQWAVLNGDSETGVTIMYMAPELDAGDIISQKKTAILPDETSGELFERLMVLGAGLLADTLEDIESGKATRTTQEESLVTYAPPLSKDMSPINWNKSAVQIKNQVRGLIPWPVAAAEIAGRSLKIFDVDTAPGAPGYDPGSIISSDKDGLLIACGDGAVLIKELQASGKKRMKASDYLRGNPIN